jgi:hypothetical protein
MLYLPPKDMEMEQAVGRATAMMLSLRTWNMSVRLCGDNSEAAVEAAIRKQVESTKLQLPDVRGQLADLQRGLPVQRRIGASNSKDEAEEMEETTLEEIHSQ